MNGPIAAILLGAASIVFLIRLKRVGCRRLKSNAEKRLWKKWVSACCLGLFLSLPVPGLLEIVGGVPVGSLSCAGAILSFLIIVRSGHWYCQRLSKLRAVKRFEVNHPEFRPSPNGSRARHKGF
jgi:hypothetical protein